MFRTAKQRKEFCAECPIARVVNLIGDPFTLLIIRDLLKGPKRFSDLEISLSGVSTRTLSRKLKDLRDCGLVTHYRPQNKSSRFLYALTKKGMRLRLVAESMRRFGEQNL